jgi:hypothetical protein
MSPTSKNTQAREDEDEDRAEAPEVDEWDEEPTSVSYSDEREIDFDEDDLADDIELDDLFAMEGPDA